MKIWRAVSLFRWVYCEEGFRKQPSCPQEVIQLVKPIIDKPPNKFNKNPWSPWVRNWLPRSGAFSHASRPIWCGYQPSDVASVNSSQQQQTTALLRRKVLSKNFMTLFYKFIREDAFTSQFISLCFRILFIVTLSTDSMSSPKQMCNDYKSKQNMKKYVTAQSVMAILCNL
jgi:hypothetical protein